MDLAGIQEKQATLLGFHGYATEQQALAHPNSVSLLQKANLNILEADYKQALREGAQPGGPNASNPLAAGLQGAANIGGIAAIGDFFNRLTQKNTWIRVGEVLAGLMLVWIGFNAITKDTAVGQGLQKAKRGAMKVAEVVPK